MKKIFCSDGRRKANAMILFPCILMLFSGCGLQHESNIQTTPGGMPEPVKMGEQTSEPRMEAESQTGAETEESVQTKAIAAYLELLASYPAVEGQPDEFMDLTFGAEENLAKFGTHYDFFSIADLNEDGIPELIAQTIVNQRWTQISLFTYDDSVKDISTKEADKLVLLKNPENQEARVTLEQMCTAGGGYEFYLCKEKHIHSMWSGDTPVGYQEENAAYILEEKQLKPAACKLGSHDCSMAFSEAAQKNTEENRKALKK